MIRRIYCSGAGTNTVTSQRRVVTVRSNNGILNFRRYSLLKQQQSNQNQNHVQKSITLTRWCNDESFYLTKLFSTTTSTSKGEILYQQALELMKQTKNIDDKREQERSQIMYEAWRKTQEKELNPKSQGVKVIRTLVKETRKDKSNNDNTSGKKIEAIELLKQAATDYDHPEAAIQLGNMLLNEASRSINTKNNGDGNKRQNGSVPINLVTQAMELFRQAGEAGSRVGWYNLGHLQWTGFPPPKDDKGGNTDDGNFKIDEEEDTQMVVADIEEAMNAFQKAIDLGDNDAMYLVGVHRLDQGDQENCKYGIKLIEQASDAGHGGALYYLALLHLNGEVSIRLEPCSLNDFVKRLDRAVEAGNVDAKFVRGNSHYHGTEGYPHDFKKALDDFLQAADVGHAESAVSAGAMLHNGVGVLKDQRRAFELYQLAGELGSEEGWINVVDCWQQGLGVPKSEYTAQYIKETLLKKKE